MGFSIFTRDIPPAYYALRSIARRSNGAYRDHDRTHPGNLITHLRKLEDAGYINTEKTGNGPASRTTVALTQQGRTALERYTISLRDLLAGL